MPNSNTINKAPPFLELSRTTLEAIDTEGLDIENVLSVWTGLTKCSGFIKNGKRLENISWRIVNRQLVNNRAETTRQDDSTTVTEPVLSTSLMKSTKKLNDGDLFSLLSIVSEETIGLQQRPQLTKRKSSTKVHPLTKRTSHNRSTESLDKRPPMFRKSSSSKSLKKLNQKRRSHVDLPTITSAVPVPNDSDLFEQPHPRYAFGIYDNTEEEGDPQDSSPGATNATPSAPSLKRTDTSTSVVRGFSPNHPSVATLPTQEPEPAPPVQKHASRHARSTPSLFGNNANKSSSSSSTTSTVENGKSSLFGNGKTTSENKPPSLFTQRPPPTQRSRSTDRVKSPLSHEATSEVLKGKSASSLFDKPPSKASKTPSLFDHAQPAPAPQERVPSDTMKSLLFEQVGISPNLRKNVHPPNVTQAPSQLRNDQESAPEAQGPEVVEQQVPLSHPHPKKRTSVLNNLGMTSFTKKEPKKEKNMFFIESSPSPTESVTKFIDSHMKDVTTLSQELQHQPPGKAHHLHHHHHHQHGNASASSSKSPPPPKQQQPEKSKSSLFQGKMPVREILFSSDDSLSEESDWSSVSEDMDSDEEDEAHHLENQWRRTAFVKRDEAPSKPQIKRSLLSGLFLSEMHPDVPPKPSTVSATAGAGPVTPPPVPTTLVTSPTPVASKANSTDGHELSSSLSSANIQVKHRHSTSTNEKAPLELTTTEPHPEISTSHVTVPGLVNEPHLQSDTLKNKLEEANNTPLSSSFSQIAKSAFNLTNYFGNHRKNSFSSIASDRTRVRFKHESNAPPTASTLLPTALSTHMFLPNAHQRAKSRLASVMETTDGTTSSAGSSNHTSRKGSTTAGTMHSDELPVAKPIKSPTVPIKHNKFKVDYQDETDAVVVEPQHTERSLKNYNNISRKLSPKTTRKQMLATELSDSLRKSILWDRQYGMYPVGEKIKIEEDATNGEVKEKTSKAPKVIKPELEKNDDDEWEKESFYARGW